MMKTLIRIACTALFTVALAAQAGAQQPDSDRQKEDVTASVSGTVTGAEKQSSSGEASKGEPAAENDRTATGTPAAETPADEARPEPSEPLSGPEPSGRSAFEREIAALAREKLGVPEEGDEPETLDREALVQLAIRAFYTGADAAPIWVNEGGPTAKAGEVAVKIARAGEWGLDPEDYTLPEPPGSGASKETLAGYELAMTQAVLAYAHHAKAGRVHPSEVRHEINDPESLADPRSFLASLRQTDDVTKEMHGLHPRHPQFVALKKKLAELRDTGDGKPRTQLPDGPVLKTGVTHPHVALLRQRLGVEDGDNAEKYDDAVQEAVKEFQKSKGLKQDGVVGNNTRHAMNGESNDQLIVRIIANMERWRWLPDNMDGEAGLHVWVNIPEYRGRVIKNGETVFNERVIVGKTYKQTPVFSDQMEWIEIHPTWYVPNSIKVEDIKPSLRRTTSTVVERYHLQIDCGRHGRDWRRIDWNVVDIRKCSVSQPPGQRSVLGDFKFKFPNKHDVYMHDTPTKNLFKTSTRTYSHGCVRVQNPRRFAEILLEHDKGMTSTRMGEILAGPKRLHQEDLNRFVPVHMTYFTTFISDDGEFVTFPDVYGHDRRLAEKLTGKGEILPVPAMAQRRKRTPRTTRTAVETQDAVWRNRFSAN